jgi:hypothetical protein
MLKKRRELMQNVFSEPKQPRTASKSQLSTAVKAFPSETNLPKIRKR